MKFHKLAVAGLAVAGVAIFGVAMAAIFADGSLSATEPSSDPAPRDVLLPDPPEKLQPAAPSLTLPSNPQLSTASSRPEPKAADTENVYTWEDGDRTLRVVLQDDLTVQSNSATGPDDDVVAKGSKTSIVQTSANRDGTSIPVFRSESGGGLMTLPGGVLLALDPEWDKATVASLLGTKQYFLGQGF